MSTKLKVKNDFIFNRIFGRTENRQILMSLLNAILEPEGEDRLQDIEIIENTKLEKNRAEDKLGILDIRARTLTGTQINIEIQLVNQFNMDKRTLFYWSKLYTSQLSEGQAFDDLRKTITINILDFNYIELEHYHTVFHLWEDTNKDYELTDILEVHFVELPKIKKIQPDYKKPLERWMLFINGASEEVLNMAMKEDLEIEKAKKVLDYLETDEEVIRYYELREKAVHDEVTRITGARKEGIEVGKKEGIEVGKKEGIEEGIKEGKKEEKSETAKKMLAKGMDIILIEKITGLSAESIEKLKIELQKGKDI